MTTTMDTPVKVPAFDKDTDRKLTIICSKGSLDMAYPGLVLANAALAEGIEVHMFFTFWGFDIINIGTMGHLKFTPVGNPATHMMKRQIEGIDIPDVPEFLEMITDAGGHLWACRMSADMMHIDEDQLYDRVEGIISASDFMELSEGAQIIFI
jgi:peroxiredoxin family protein